MKEREPFRFCKSSLNYHFCHYDTEQYGENTKRILFQNFLHFLMESVDMPIQGKSLCSGLRHSHRYLRFLL